MVRPPRYEAAGAVYHVQNSWHLIGHLIPSFAWSSPKISHVRLDHQAAARRARNVATGKEDRRQVGIRGEFVEGGTIGPPPRSVSKDAFGARNR